MLDRSRQPVPISKATELPAQPGAGIFRAQALESLAEPDRIDIAAAVVSPSTWLVLAAASLAITGLIAALVLVQIPTTLTARAIILAPGGLTDISASAAGRVAEVAVRVGDHVGPGALLVRLADGTPLNSPASGTITAVQADAGDAISARQVVAVMAPDLLPGSGDRAVLFVEPAEAAELRPGLAVRLAGGPGDPILTGHLLWVAGRPDSVRGLLHRAQTAPLLTGLPDTLQLTEAEAAFDPVPPRMRGLPLTASLVARRQRLGALLFPNLESAFRGASSTP